MSANPLKRLGELGQSVWYDYIRRDLYTSPKLRQLIDEDGLKGMTSNPTIFQNAIAKSDLYDDDIRSAAGGGRHGDLEIDLGKRGRGENGARGGRQRVAPHQPNEGVTDDAPPATRLGQVRSADPSVPVSVADSIPRVFPARTLRLCGSDAMA